MRGVQTDVETGDLLIEGGGCVVAGSEAQTIEHVLRAVRGEFKEYPLLGGEIIRLSHGSALSGQLWSQRARTMLIGAGVAVSRVSVNSQGEVIVE